MNISNVTIIEYNKQEEGEYIGKVYCKKAGKRSDLHAYLS